MTSPPLPLPSERDLVPLVRTIYSYRFLTFQQLRRLHPSRLSSLNLLVRTRHVAAIKRPTLHTRTPDVVYALDRAGADLLTDVLGIDRAQLRWRAHRNLIGLLFLEHRLAANDVRIALTLGAAGVGAELVHWYYEPAVEADVVDPVEGVPPLSFRPDAYLHLRLADGRAVHAFLEVDRSSEGYAKIAAKVSRYLAYKEHRVFRASVGARSFRVLFTVPSTRRLQSLKRVIEEAGGRGMFWLARARDVTEATIGSAVWSVAGVEQPACLAWKAHSEPLSDADSGR